MILDAYIGTRVMFFEDCFDSGGGCGDDVGGEECTVVCVDIFFSQGFPGPRIGIVKYNDHTSAYITVWWHNTFVYTLYSNYYISHYALYLCT